MVNLTTTDRSGYLPASTRETLMVSFAAQYGLTCHEAAALPAVWEVLSRNFDPYKVFRLALKDQAIANELIRPAKAGAAVLMEEVAA